MSNNLNIRPLPFNQQYGCDTDGNIYSHKRGDEWRVMRPHDNGRGYKRVMIGTKSYLVHRLVLMTWIGPCPTDFNADHINNVTADNRLDNLRWVHKSFNYTRPKVSKVKPKKVSDELRERVMRYLKSGLTAPQIEKITGVQRSNVFNIKYSKKYRAFCHYIDTTKTLKKVISKK